MPNRLNLFDGKEGPALAGIATVADMLEDGVAIGGTSDGDMPDLDTVTGTYVQGEIVAIRDAVRENAEKMNELLTVLRAQGIVL